MNEKHLNEDELDLVLCGEGLPPDRALHLVGCHACERRRNDFLAVLEEARIDDPAAAVVATARDGALQRWGAGVGRQHRVRWWLAAAAVLLLTLLPILRHGSSPTTRRQEQQVFNPDQVLTEVDAMLSQDPLTAMTSEAVVDTVVPVGNVSWQGGA
jgi:hypothetical protein